MKAQGVPDVNVGNGHLGSSGHEGLMWGLFEHHTRLLTPTGLLSKTPTGTITNEEVFADGGHGAFVHPDRPGNRECLKPSHRAEPGESMT